MQNQILVPISQSTVGLVNQAIVSLQTVGNYKYTSNSDLYREAFDAYCNGDVKLVELPTDSPKKRIAFLVDDAAIEKYEKLPRRAKGIIIERAILGFLKNIKI